MLTDSAFQELLNYESENPVLSVYLNVSAPDSSVDPKRTLRALLKDCELEEDKEAMLRYFEREREWRGRGLAMFSCAADGFFRSYAFAVPVHDRKMVGARPYVRPLADLLDSYGGYGVVLIDKQGARLFLFHLGELKEQEGTLGEEVRHTKRGGASSVHGQRGGASGQTRADEAAVKRNLKESAAFAARFFEENRVRRILVGGTEETVARFCEELPKTWQSPIVGTFPMSMSADSSEVLARAMEIGERAEKKREDTLIETVVTSAAKGENGVIRLDETLSAVREGRVQILIVQEGYHAPGYQCTGCGYLTTQKLESCPFCGGALEEIPDAVEMAIRQTMQNGGEVEIIHDNPKIEKFGIGGLLRY